MLFLISGNISNTPWLHAPLLCPPISIVSWGWGTQVRSCFFYQQTFNTSVLLLYSHFMHVHGLIKYHQCCLAVLQVFRPLRHRSQKKRRPRLRTSHVPCRGRACWVSAPLDQPPPAPSSPPVVYLGTALPSAVRPPQTAQGDPFPPLWHLERYVHRGTNIE